ncbi:MAG: efflux RND transporter periplasmic adaptor subunit [Planctomycetota bacterium]
MSEDSASPEPVGESASNAPSQSASVHSGDRLAWTAGGVLAVAGVLVGFLAGLAIGGGSGPGPEGGGGPPDGEGGKPPALVSLATAQTMELRPKAAVEGRLTAPRRAEVAGEVEGPILDVMIDEGDRVFGPQGEGRPGTALATVDKVWLKQSLDQATAELHAAESELERSQNELDDLVSLNQGGAAQPQEVRDARTVVAGNTARVESAKAARDRAQTDLDRASTYAPFDGVVVAKHAEKGQWMSRGGVVAEIVSVDPIDAEIDVPESLVNAVEAVGDATFEVEVPALRKRIPAKVRSVNYDGLNAARTYPVKLSIANPNGELKPGMTVTAYPPNGPAGTYLTVPRDAVQFDERGAVVWVSTELQPGAGLVAMPAGVEVLFGEGDRFAVRVLPTAGPPLLADGASVIVSGAERLFPTQPLMPSGAGGPPADGGGGAEVAGGAPGEVAPEVAASEGEG